jgi:hypothetical protein
MESDTRFSTSGFFHGSVSPWPLSILLGPFQIFMKIRGVFAPLCCRLYLCLLTGDNCHQCRCYRDKLSLVSVTEVIKPCPGFFIDSMTPEINLSLVTTTPAIINRPNIDTGDKLSPVTATSTIMSVA